MTRTLCRASAGTGKTYSLCEEVAAAVRADTDPARILGATFTNKAAAELKARVQERILRDAALAPQERVERAERLELAALGTVHSLGHRLLRRYALTMGLSPRLDVLDEDAAQRLLDDTLGAMPLEPWDELIAAGAGMGIEEPKKLAKALLALQRTNRIQDADLVRDVAASAERVSQLLGGPDPTVGTLDDVLEEAKRAYDRLDQGFRDDPTGATRGARDTLRKVIDHGMHAWRDGAQCIGLKAGRGSGADAALDDLRACATQVLRMPALHEDLRRCAALLARQTVALGRAYQEAKTARGLLDFADLEAMFLDLLERDDVARDLRETFDLVLVDEFQDTNPVQLAIFVRLHDIVGRSFWVGDEKQAIYGFRGADSQLMENVWTGDPIAGANPGAPDLLAQALPGEAGDDPRTLRDNYRSQAGLVAFFNEVFVPVFGEEARVAAKRPAQLVALERWNLLGKDLDADAVAIAAGVRQLRDEGVPLRDIALLARTNERARRIADELYQAGIPCVASRPGLLKTRECAAALAALRVLRDRRDALAATEVLHLLGDGRETTPAWLATRLAEAQAGPDTPYADHPVLAPLRALDVRALPPADALSAVVHALDLPRRIATWGHPARRAANLDALLTLARDVQDDAIEQGRAATIAGLVAALERMEEDKEDTFPVPSGVDAVTVTTYHAAKGREWPVVILTSLDTEPKPDPWRPRVLGGNAAAGHPLEGRRIEAWMWPLGNAGPPWHARTGRTPLTNAALQSPEGQALATAEQQEATRLLYVGMTRAKDRLILAHRWSAANGPIAPWLEGYARVDALADPGLDPGEHALPGCDTTLRIRHLDPATATHADLALDGHWIAEPALPPAAAPVPRYLRPSDAKDRAATFGPRQALAAGPLAPGPLALPRLDEPGYERLGRAVHAYLAALPALEGQSPAERLGVAARCLRGFASEGALAPEALVEVGARLQRWVTTTYPGAAWSTEVPATAPAADAATWSGVLDLLLTLPDGGVVIIDHKTTPIPAEAWAERAPQFAGQLGAYRDMLERHGLRVVACWVHLPMGGAMVEVMGRAEAATTGA